MVKLTQLPHEDYETWIDTDQAEKDAARIESGAKFKTLDDDWDEAATRRVIRQIEFV